MRIGIDARFWDETGVGRYIRNLVKELQKIDTTNDYVLFVLPKNYNEIASMLDDPRWKVVSTPIAWHSLAEQRKFPSLLNLEQLDLMHFTYFSIPILYRKPFVVTIHDLILHHFPTGEATTLPRPFYYGKLLAYKAVIADAARKAQKIITVSQATKNEIIDHLHVTPEKIEVIYEGFSLQEKKRQRANTYGNYFLHVGNVYPHKNAKRLVDAFLKLNRPETKLIFVGKKDHFMQDLENYAHAAKNVVFTGFVDDEELASLYSHALATVVPSLMEGFGLPVVEAMANGSLVLASAIPSLQEVAKDAAIFFDPLDIADISAKMRTIVESDPKRFAQLCKKGTLLARQFSWEKMARATLKIYESSISIRQGQ
ncbi:MAG TPA: glycosyltransferase family 1 protein [Patescibacteria group bacterium]|nr:glycosyltransferase family 1 protein [Patescibacteria group bacterium]